MKYTLSQKLCTQGYKTCTNSVDFSVIWGCRARLTLFLPLLTVCIAPYRSIQEVILLIFLAFSGPYHPNNIFDSVAVPQFIQLFDYIIVSAFVKTLAFSILYSIKINYFLLVRFLSVSFLHIQLTTFIFISCSAKNKCLYHTREINQPWILEKYCCHTEFWATVYKNMDIWILGVTMETALWVKFPWVDFGWYT